VLAVPRGPGITTLLVVAALAVAACTGSNGQQAADDTTTTTAGPTTETTAGPTTTTAADEELAPEEQVAQAYLRFWEVRLEANGEPPDPEHPALAQVATGEQLENVIAETRRRLEQGLAVRPPEPSVASHEVTVLRVGDTDAELQDCFVNDGIVYRIETGETIDDSVVTRSVSARMELVDGQWRLARATVLQEWEGVAGCALAAQ
jgi:hypothetical protein